ncbi:hypothetical protein GCM10010423_65370 [Streptomyces levis]|uniref:Uncharacterized protein n=1 Tax=Streptomyces levis TaxID=285566 RepID=A0ABN3P3R2_9ACTN
MNTFAEEIEVARELAASFGAGSGSRAADRGARGRQGSRNVGRGTATRLRNRIAGAQQGNRGRGSRARRQQLNELAERARGNSRGNINRRTARDLSARIRQITAEIRRMGG